VKQLDQISGGASCEAIVSVAAMCSSLSSFFKSGCSPVGFLSSNQATKDLKLFDRKIIMSVSTESTKIQRSMGCTETDLPMISLA